MAQNNSGKWKDFQNGQILYGPSGLGQNLNDDLQKRIADEIDQFLAGLVGDGVVGTSSWVVSAATGLSVSVTAGVGLLQGQQLRSSGTLSVSGLAASTANQTIYVTSAAGWSSTLKAWPISAGVKTGAVAANELWVASVDTDGSGVTLVTDRRRILTPVSSLTEQKNSRARAASFGVL